MLSLERPIILRAVKASSAVVAAFLAYQTFCLYRRNNITVRITELVRLPPQGRIDGNPNGADFIHNNPTIELKGSIEVETYLMRSYRFLLKLSAQLNGATLGCGTYNGGDENVCKRSIQRRVLSFATAYNNTNINTANDMVNMGNLSISNSLISQSYNKGSVYSSSRTSAKPKGPMIEIKYVNEMVDQNEVLVNENICFTPACLSEEILMKYTMTISSAYLLNSQPALSSTAGDTTDPFNTKSMSPQSFSNLLIQNAFLRPGNPGNYCISFDLMVFQPLHELRLLIRLPNHHCRLVRSDTGGIGRVTFAEGKTKPHLLIWEIGGVDAHIHNDDKKVSNVEKGCDDETLSQAALSVGGGDDVVHGLSSFAFLSVHFELVYRHLEESEYFYYDNEGREDSDSNIDSDNIDFFSSDTSSTNDEDARETDLIEGQMNATGVYSGSKYGSESRNSRRRGYRKSSFGKKPHSNGTPSPTNHSDKARKRKALASKKNLDISIGVRYQHRQVWGFPRITRLWKQPTA
ncbi:unnamed protein product [Phytomonas sp. Hart1]|nr:unnamed protein product [Phytomonas sp. Hart1]|eukprot:CCW69150.1 unnamed protein product [Phytomonas sp. isolate Hart1]